MCWKDKIFGHIHVLKCGICTHRWIMFIITALDAYFFMNNIFICFYTMFVLSFKECLECNSFRNS